MAKTLTGIVSSDKADKTITVAIRTSKTHPIYKKQYTVTKRLLVHDELNEARVSDKVSIVETRPISARKHFKLAKILEKAAIREDQTVEAITKEEPKAEKIEKTKVSLPKKATKVESVKKAPTEMKESK